MTAGPPHQFEEIELFYFESLLSLRLMPSWFPGTPLSTSSHLSLPPSPQAGLSFEDPHVNPRHGLSLLARSRCGMYPPAALVEVHLDRETEVANSALHLIVVDPTLAVCSLRVLSHTSLVLPRCVFFFWFRNGLFVFSHPRKLFFCFSSLLLPIRCLLNLFLQLVWYVRCVC